LGCGGLQDSGCLARGFGESCTTLGDLLIDPEFSRFIRDLRDPGFEKPQAINEIGYVASDARSMEAFLEAERELFTRAGLPVSHQIISFSAVKN
jgi:hypothetical protein